jgi:hypothetical protein
MKKLVALSRSASLFTGHPGHAWQLLPTVLVVAAALGLPVMTGCQRKPSAGPTATNEHHEGDGHDHGEVGPHGGHIIELGDENYHAELSHDDASHKVGVYLLDGTAKSAAPIDAPSVTINSAVNNQPAQFTIPAVPQPGDPAGSASYFELVSEELCDRLDAQDAHARLNIAIAGKPYVGVIEIHDHHHDHDHDHE